MVQDDSEDCGGHIDAYFGRGFGFSKRSILQSIKGPNAFGMSLDVTMRCPNINGGFKLCTIRMVNSGIVCYNFQGNAFV